VPPKDLDVPGFRLSYVMRQLSLFESSNPVDGVAFIRFCPIQLRTFPLENEGFFGPYVIDLLNEKSRILD